MGRSAVIGRSEWDDRAADWSGPRHNLFVAVTIRGSAPRAIIKLHFGCCGAVGAAGLSSFAMHLVMNVLRAWPVSF